MLSSRITHKSQDLTTSELNLAEGRTLEEVVVHQCTFYSRLRKPECCEETIEALFGLQNHGFIWTLVKIWRTSAMLVRMTEC